MANFRTPTAFQMPPVTKNLIIINVIVWLAEVAVPGFSGTLLRHIGLHYVGSDLFNPIQIITYMFAHDPSSPVHIFFNMFTLWMFGRTLEMVWGSRRFFLFYFVCGIGASLIQEAVWALSWEHDYISGIARLNGLTFDTMRDVVRAAQKAGDADFALAMAAYRNQMMTVGASGAIFGLLLGYAFVFPNQPLYLFFIPVPIKAKYMVMGYAVIEFFLGVGGRADTIAHFAHLGGMIFGLAMLLWWRHKGTLRGNFFY